MHYVLTKASMLLCLCVSVYLSFFLYMCLTVTAILARWLNLATWYHVRLIPFTRPGECNIRQHDLFPDSYQMDHPDKITFWTITSKLIDKFTPKD